MSIKLSILIATMPTRSQQLAELMAVLQPQIIGGIEVITDNSITYNIGTKRNLLLQMAHGEYVVYIDDDDMISHDYVRKILSATGADCMGISGKITTNGANEQQWHISKDFGHWFEFGQIYYRTPNHISPVRRELALQAGFPEISHGEDYEYSMRLLPLLKTENKVAGNLYFYKYCTK